MPADTWDAEMQQHFEQLQRSLTDAIAQQFGLLEVRLVGRLGAQVAVMGAQLEERLERRLDTRMQDLEGRLDRRFQGQIEEMGRRFQVQTEELRELVRTLADSYGGVLEGVRRDLRDLNTKMDLNFSDHQRLLANHDRRLRALERLERRQHVQAKPH